MCNAHWFPLATSRLRGTGWLCRGSRTGWLFALLLVICCGRTRAQTFKAPDPGPGVVTITGTWQFHTGDDLAWANPIYNDAEWQAIRADEPWGAQGHSGYTGYAWYRKRLDIGADDQPLGIAIPECDGAYEVYWNGQRIGSSGRLPPHAAWYVAGEKAAFSLSGRGAKAGVLALRFWVPPGSTTADPADGGMRLPPQMGRVPLLQKLIQFAILRRQHENLPTTIATSLIGAGALLSLLLFLRRRQNWLYLWLAILLLSNVLDVVSFLSIQSIYFAAYQMALQLRSVTGDVGLWLMLLWIFGLNTSRRWRVTAAIVIALYLALQLIDSTCFWFWQYAGPGFARADMVTTDLYTALELFPLLLVGFGLFREKTSSLIPLGLIAAIYGAWEPVQVFLYLIRPALGDRMGLWGLELGTYHFGIATLLSWLLILTLAFTVARRQLAEGRRQAHLEGKCAPRKRCSRS